MFKCRKRQGQHSVSEEGKRQRTSKALMYCQQRFMFSKHDPLQDPQKPWAALGCWFLGPKAENGDIFRDLVSRAIDSQIQFRHSYFPCDPTYVTEELRQAGSFQTSLENLRSELDNLQIELKNSVPFFSSRYKGHVLWETAMPANLGYISALLFNQNNCAAEASTVTTKFEVEVGTDLSIMMGYEKERCMGHLVAGGSVANIEAIWAARNVKYFPLGLQEALMNEDKLSAAKEYSVFFPQKDKVAELKNASKWELLNLDTKTILNMPSEVEQLTKLSHGDFMEIMSKYLYESIGAQGFARRHKLTQSPCLVAPSTAHISFTKAVTVLGLGRESLVTVPVDEDSRMDTKELERILEQKLKDETPVVAVVSVMGTTEESAVDPLADILDIRETFSKKGLNFCVHADGAWGGYFCSMLRDQPKGHHMRTPEESGFVPELYLSTYVHNQLSVMCHCDTITIDPHKSGFCPYPAGALCYRDKRMNTFLQITTNVVYYHGDMTLGDIGLEGSKPGAAAAGVMLANRVIGLHKNGYGRILAECMFTAKILYCLWVTLAREDDNFVIETTKPLPKWKNMGEKEQIQFIRNRILGRSNQELAQDEEAMQYLKEVGPDTMIPCFSVNLKGNTETTLCNAINMAIFQDLCHSSSEHTAHRIPMIVTASSLVHHKHSSSLKNFKKRLGVSVQQVRLNVKDPQGQLNPDDGSPVKYIITTCMDPWATSVEFMDDMAAIMRNSILCAIGTATDPLSHHLFISTGVVSGQNEIIVYYSSNFKNPGNQYDTVAKLKFISSADVDKFTASQEQQLKSSTEPLPIVLRSKNTRLHDVFFGESEYGDDSELFDYFIGMPLDDSKPFMSANMKVVDVPRYEHFDNDEYPEASLYFLYGDKKSAFLFHVPSKLPDFLQAIHLDGIPDGMGTAAQEDLLLKHGIEVEMVNVPGSPVSSAGEIMDPLNESEYDIAFVGIDGKDITTKVRLGRKIWFDTQILNRD